MKSVLAFALLFCLFVFPLAGQEILHTDGGLRMAVISDLHIMHPGLVIEHGEAFENYLMRDRKMLLEGPLILHKAIDELIEEKPDVVLIPGDLTKDGEWISHHWLRDEFLSKLSRAGIRVFVIPGNHDINNPHAVSFNGKETQQVATITAGEFAGCYASYGYTDAVARDPYSLTYLAALSDSVFLLAIDACLYEENDFDANRCMTGGSIKPETMEFIRTHVSDLHTKGIRVIGMMHHGIVQHWKYQEKAFGEYLVNDWKKQAKALAGLGIEVVFTGHFHAQDVASYSYKGNVLYDIQTGSTVTYPVPYRMVSLKGNEMNIQTRLLLPEDIRFTTMEAFQQYANSFVMEGISHSVAGMLPGKVPEALRQETGQSVGRAFTAHYRGDEVIPITEKQQVQQTFRKLRKYNLKYALIYKKITMSLWRNTTSADNNLTIYLQHK